MADLASREISVPGAAVRSAGLAAQATWPGYALAFVASCAILVLELLAGRMLAPFVGVSLYTWTSIIGVVLAGISLGSWLGGRIADRHASGRLLGVLFAAAGLLTLATLVLVGLLGDGGLVKPLPLLGRIFLLSSLVFLPPSLVLGMVTPLTIRLALPEVGRTGRVVGLVYACATLGSLVGNFLTGFVLTAYFPIQSIVIATGGLLLLAGLVSLPWRTRSLASTAAPLEPGRSDSAAPASSELNGSAPGRFSLRSNPSFASAVVVISSFATMAIELAASRMLAPIVGISLYSWTGILGAVLAGITVGNFLGGRLADRRPNERVLAACLAASGFASFGILFLLPLAQTGGLFGDLGLMGRVVALTALLFLLPVLLLGTISPQVIRLAISDLASAGRVSGQIYAWSTAGAIVGTFATGWWLISLVGVNNLVFGMGALLLALAILVGQLWSRPAPLLVLLVFAGSAVLGLNSRDGLQSTCTRETNYFCIRVKDEFRDGGPVKTLILDHLVHSYVRPGDPSYLGYEHEYVQAELTRFLFDRTGLARVLVIGGGGYTYPRWVDATLPGATVEVVEIDPGVTEVVHDHLGMPRDTHIVSYNLDGRQFVHESAPKGQYALVVQDAVNDLSVPYHIMTREYNDQVHDLLAPGGAYLLTVIDLFDQGQLLRAALRTMTQTFPQVELLSATRSWDSGGAAVWVVAGSQDGIDLEALQTLLERDGLGPSRTLRLAPERLRAYLAEGSQIVLTDQYAPVDNLIAPLFTRRG